MRLTGWWSLPRLLSGLAALGVVTVVTLYALVSSTGSEVADGLADRPNIILIITDDQRWDSINEMPLVDGRSDWARFENSFVHEPQCCPSRATYLSGQYSYTTGVTTLRDGEDLDETRTVATMLDEAGYQTQFSGKYLNGYPFDRGDYVPPGWDDFIAFAAGDPLAPQNERGRAIDAPYYNYVNIENGSRVAYGDDPSDYSTDRYTELARQFIREADPDAPVFVNLAPIAPHFTVVPAERHVGSCADVPFPLPANFNMADTVDEPAWMAQASDEDPAQMVFERRETCETLRAVDDAVDGIIDELDATGRLDNTYIIFTSDNGYSFGERRLTGKGHLYEESIRVPLLVMGPDVEPGSTGRLTTNADLAPTILEWAGVEPPADFFDGRSFADELRGDDTAFDPAEVLLLGCRTTNGEGDYCGGYPEYMGHAWGIRTERYKYVDYPQAGDQQLFDLVDDPLELTNLVTDPDHAAVLEELQSRLSDLTSTTGTIRGRVTYGDTEEPVVAATVNLNTEALGWMAFTTTDSDGRFAFLPLPPDTYKIRFDDPELASLREFSGNATSLAGATELVLEGGDTIVSDAELLAPGIDTGAISGTAVDTNTGLPLADISVWLYQDEQGWLTNTITDADGRYSFVVKPGGAYKVRFTDPRDDYERQFSGGVSTLEDAADISVERGAVVEADIELEP